MSTFMATTRLAACATRRPPLLALSPATTVREAAHSLHVAQVTSAPVLDDSTEVPIRGFVTAEALGAAVIDAVTELGPAARLGAAAAEAYAKAGEDVGDQRLDVALRLAWDRNDGEFIPDEDFESAYVADALRGHVLRPNGLLFGVVHHVAAYSTLPDGAIHLTAVLSQSDVVELLAKSAAEALGERGETTVGELIGAGLLKDRVVSVSSDVTALEAFGTSLERAVSSIALVTPEGKLHGHAALGTAVRDAESLAAFAAGLGQPVWESVHLHGGVIPPTMSLATAVRALAVSHAHHLFVVDERMRPLAPFTLTDALRLSATPLA